MERIMSQLKTQNILTGTLMDLEIIAEKPSPLDVVVVVAVPAWSQLNY